MIPLLAAVLLATTAATPAKPLAKPPATPVWKGVEGPVAVMPFKELVMTNSSAEWLNVGIAETLISDLKKSGKVRVVERSQIDHAMSEILFKAETVDTNEEVTMVKAGRLVGAKTLVLGSYQVAEGQLRINARFVSVETGEILRTAKVTGKRSDPFAVQDKIYAELLGLAEKSPELPKRRPPTEKSLQAYELYAMALTVATDAQRVGYLKKSIAVDPDFTYSIDELAALEKRLGIYHVAAEAVFNEDEAALRTKALDPKNSVEDRARAAKLLLDRENGSRHFHAMERDAQTMYEMHLPRGEAFDISEYASYWRIYAATRLRKLDAALQLGEAHLKEFPGGFNYTGAEALVKSVIAERERWATRKKEWVDDVGEKRADLSEHARARAEEDKKRGKGDGKPALTDREQEQWDFAPCIAATWNSEINEVMLENCSNFLDKWERNDDVDVRANVVAAHFSVLAAMASLGRFAEAKERADKCLAEPDCTKQYGEGLKGMMSIWPAD